jgi:hypothetical protein
MSREIKVVPVGLRLEAVRRWRPDPPDTLVPGLGQQLLDDPLAFLVSALAN